MKNKSAKKAVWVNFAVLAVAAFVWAALASPVSVTAMAGSGRFPVYRGASKTAVSLQCVVDWDAAGMEEIADILEREGTAITFFVSAEWARGHAPLLKRLFDAGNEIAVLAKDAKEAADETERITGSRPRLAYVGSGSAAGVPRGLIPVACTADLGCGGGTYRETAAKAARSISAGSIISVSPTADFVQALPEMIKIIKNMGLDIVPTYKMLYN